MVVMLTTSPSLKVCSPTAGAVTPAPAGLTIISRVYSCGSPVSNTAVIVLLSSIVTVVVTLFLLATSPIHSLK